MFGHCWNIPPPIAIPFFWQIAVRFGYTIFGKTMMHETQHWEHLPPMLPQVSPAPVEPQPSSLWNVKPDFFASRIYRFPAIGRSWVALPLGSRSLLAWFFRRKTRFAKIPASAKTLKDIRFHSLLHCCYIIIVNYAFLVSGEAMLSIVHHGQ